MEYISIAIFVILLGGGIGGMIHGFLKGNPITYFMGIAFIFVIILVASYGETKSQKRLRDAIEEECTYVSTSASGVHSYYCAPEVRDRSL